MSARWLPWEQEDERAPLAARIAAATARAIIEGAHQGGDLLTEAELAETAQASRTPAREAMLQLESWALVRLLPKKGAIVTSPTPKERQDMLAFRALIEIDAVQAIARGEVDEAELAAGIDDALARQRAAVAAADSFAFASADYAFHAQLIRSGGNIVVERQLETLGPRIARFTYLAITENPARVAVLLEEHERLGRVALSGDAAEYGAVLRTHIAGGHFAH